MNARHLALIHDLLDACDSIGLPVWLESGWAIDARLGRISREHEDIDFAIPAERMPEFQALLRTRGAGLLEWTDYGFLVRVNGVLMDCEPCRLIDGEYELEGVPAGSCPMEPQGTIGGRDVRCTSWQAIVWEYFQYLDEVPHAEWPAKDKEAFLYVRAAIGEAQVDGWHAQFRANRGAFDMSASIDEPVR